MFSFIDKRTKTDEEDAIILSTIQSASIEIANLQKERLKRKQRSKKIRILEYLEK